MTGEKEIFMFVNFVEEKFKDGANYSFGFEGISCQVNEARENDMNYYTELYYGDKYIRWGRFDGKCLARGTNSNSESIKNFSMLSWKNLDMHFL